MGVDATILRQQRSTENLGRELLSWHDLARIPHQHLQHAEFRCREPDDFTSQSHQAATGIDGDVPDRDRAPPKLPLAIPIRVYAHGAGRHESWREVLVG